MILCGHQEQDMISNNTQVDCGIYKACSIDTMGPKVWKKIFCTRSQQTGETVRMDPRVFVLFVKFWPDHLNVAAEIETQQTFKVFPSSLVQFWWACVDCSLSSGTWLKGLTLGVVFCCCWPSASGLVCGQRLSSAYFSCNKLLFWVTVLTFNLSVHSPPTSAISYAFSFSPRELTGYFVFWAILNKLLRWLSIKIPEGQQFLKYSDQPVGHNSQATFKVLQIIFLNCSWFELQQIIFTMSTYLNTLSCCHVIIYHVNKQYNLVNSLLFNTLSG